MLILTNADARAISSLVTTTKGKLARARLALRDMQDAVADNGFSPIGDSRLRRKQAMVDTLSAQVDLLKRVHQACY